MGSPPVPPAPAVISPPAPPCEPPVCPPSPVAPPGLGGTSSSGAGGASSKPGPGPPLSGSAARSFSSSAARSLVHPTATALVRSSDRSAGPGAATFTNKQCTTRNTGRNVSRIRSLLTASFRAGVRGAVRFRTKAPGAAPSPLERKCEYQKGSVEKPRRPSPRLFVRTTRYWVNVLKNAVVSYKPPNPKITHISTVSEKSMPPFKMLLFT